MIYENSYKNKIIIYEFSYKNKIDIKMYTLEYPISFYI